MPSRVIKETIKTSKNVNALSDFQFRVWIHLILSADDYGDGVAGKTAALVYSQLDASGEVDAAAVLSRFEDLEDQQEAAQILHTSESTASAAESRKAILETLRRVYQAAPLRVGEGQDALSAAIQKKKNLENIRKINLILE